MAARATEAPTARRLAEARRRGAIAVSPDLTAAGAMAGAALALLATAPALWRGALGLARAQWTAALGGHADVAVAGRAALRAVAWASAPVLAAAVAGAFGFGLLQTRGAIAVPLRRGGGSLDGRLMALLLALGKVAVLAAVAWATLRPATALVAALGGTPPERALGVLGVLAARMAVRLAIALVLLGAADYAVRWAANRRALRMTPEEIKRQRRETEGDERLRARRRQVHRSAGKPGSAASSTPTAP